MTQLEGKTIGGRYKIIEPLGKGGFGETFKAIDMNAFNSLVVIKRIERLKLHDPKANELFQREAKKLHELNNKLSRHNQIPQFKGFFPENQEFYLVQEFIDGKTLEEEIQQKKQLKEDEVVNLLKDLLKVLKFTHNNKIIHRDIKPSNVILRKDDGKPVLIDFGAVKQVINSYTSNATVIGTPGYAPPEQVEGKPRFNSDIYALGITALQALTGLQPDNCKVEDSLKRILEKMVEEDYRSRYQSVDEVLLDLEKIPSTHITQPPSQPKVNSCSNNTQPLPQPSSKQPFFVAFMSIGVVGIIFAIAGIFPRNEFAVQKEPISPLPANTETEAEEADLDSLAPVETQAPTDSQTVRPQIPSSDKSTSNLESPSFRPPPKPPKPSNKPSPEKFPIFLPAEKTTKPSNNPAPEKFPIFLPAEKTTEPSNDPAPEKFPIFLPAEKND